MREPRGSEPRGLEPRGLDAVSCNTGGAVGSESDSSPEGWGFKSHHRVVQVNV